MAFTKIKELTVSEVLALTFVEFKYDRFTTNKLTTYLCTFLTEPFQVSKIAAVEDLLRIASDEKLVDVAVGPRGGPGYKINAAGSAFVSEVDLPNEKFIRRGDLDDEKSLEANANVGPVFKQLLALIPDDKAEFWRERDFVEKLARYWRDQGWLSSKQVAALVQIAANHGLYVEGRHYIGSALDEWRRPYIEAALRQQAEAQARTRASAAAREAARQEREHVKAIVRDANRQVKVVLEEMEQNGLLNGLDALVTEVFPGTTLSTAAKASAYAGHGAHNLRICVAALAFGKPPSQIWGDAGSHRQRGVESKGWKTLTAHPAFLALGRPLYDDV